MRTFNTLTLTTFYYYYLSVFPVILPAQKIRSNGLLKEMNAECIKEGIKVHLFFQKPFHGVAYSYGHYDNAKCRYIEQDSPLSGGTNYTFLIPARECGTIHHGHLDANTRQQRQSNGTTQKWETLNNSTGGNLYIENMLLIQKDASIQEIGDLAQTIRCIFQEQIYRPLVASLPFQTVQRRTSPPKFSTHKYQNWNNTSVVNGGRVRFESMKGQVQSVPHYNNYRKKWSRSLRNGEQEEKNEDQEVEPKEMLLPFALALESQPPQSSNNAAHGLYPISRSSHGLFLSITFLFFFKWL